MEIVDQTLTKILLQADRQCHPFQAALWSPEVHMAYLAHRFWALTFSAKKNERDLLSALTSLAKRIDLALTLQDPAQSISSHLRIAQKHIKQVHQVVAKHCKAHLEAILNQVHVANLHKETKALQYLIRAERNCQCYARFRQHMKPKSSGSLAFVNVMTVNGDKKPLLDHDKLEEMLLEHSQMHFARTDGMPFTQELLGRLLQYDGLTSFGDLITQGKQVGTIHQFDEPTQAILSNL